MCCDLPDVRGRHVVLGVTGGIAVYKSCEIVSRLRKLGVETHVIMTKNAAQFVQPLTFETLSNHPVVTDTFARPETWEVEHIALAKRADVLPLRPRRRISWRRWRAALRTICSPPPSWQRKRRFCLPLP